MSHLTSLIPSTIRNFELEFLGHIKAQGKECSSRDAIMSIFKESIEVIFQLNATLYVEFSIVQDSFVN